MCATDVSRGTTHGLRRIEPRVDAAWLPLKDPLFWAVQAVVVALMALHDFVLGEWSLTQLGGVPATFTFELLWIPVVYAMFIFGVRGAVGTAFWISALTITHWFFVTHLTATHLRIELGFLVLLNAVAIFVGRRVESDQQARQRSEALYHNLFEDPSTPIILTDAFGIVGEMNSAAIQLLGKFVKAQPITQVLGLTVRQLVNDDSPCITLRSRRGEERFFSARAHKLAYDDGTGLVQIVLTEVTEQLCGQEGQRLTAEQLLNVQEEERGRLARELHDEPLQYLTFLTRTLDDLSIDAQLPAELVARLTQSAEVANDASTALRKLIHGLRPPVLDDLGLVSALRQLIDEIRQRTALNVDLEIVGEETRLAPDLELAAYRIAQESLTNVVKHSNAESANIQLRFGEKLVLTVADDGCGLPNNLSQRCTGLGLRGMRERVIMAGGSFEVKSRSPHGVIVHATLPVEDKWTAGFPDYVESDLEHDHPSLAR
jgi:signal transduction histidine kinase